MILRFYSFRGPAGLAGLELKNHFYLMLQLKHGLILVPKVGSWKV